MSKDPTPMAEIPVECLQNIQHGLQQQHDRLKAIAESFDPLNRVFIDAKDTDEQIAVAFTQWSNLNHAIGYLQGLANGLEFYLPNDAKDHS